MYTHLKVALSLSTKSSGYIGANVGSKKALAYASGPAFTWTHMLPCNLKQQVLQLQLKEFKFLGVHNTKSKNGIPLLRLHCLSITKL